MSDASQFKDARGEALSRERENAFRLLAREQRRPKLTKKQKAMGMTGMMITVDAGWLGRVVDNFVARVVEQVVLDKMLQSEGIVVAEIVEQEER